MSTSARLLRSLNQTARRLFGPNVVYASDQEAILASLNILESRETLEADLFSNWHARLSTQLADLTSSLSLSRLAPDLGKNTEALKAQLAQPAPTVAEREAVYRDVMRDWSALVERIAGDPRLPAETRLKIVFETGQTELKRVNELCGDLLPPDVVEDTEVTPERLQRYLVDRFSDETIKIVSCRVLPGGFGKETIMFAVEGDKFNGEFVMRRDRDEPTVDNDCHRVSREFPVIRAAFDHGFPAPEALWVDTSHALLPGGDFIIMTRAPGTTGGDVHGASGKVDRSLVELLANSVAQLHSLPPLRELGALTEAIAPELWDLPLKEVTRRYIQSIRDIYLREMAVPSPATLALYGWVLDNIPDAPGRPVLLHGDIGFHNFIVDDGRLSAVVDWEFAHIGDPADDVGYVRNTVGRSLDWDQFMSIYRAAGGPELSDARIRFFQIWGHLRNLTASQLTTNCFETGKLDELKLGHVGHSMMAGFLAPIMALMEPQSA